jgi:hypothetical protein
MRKINGPYSSMVSHVDTDSAGIRQQVLGFGTLSTLTLLLTVVAFNFNSPPCS